MAGLSFLAAFEKQAANIEGVTSQSTPPRYWFSSGNYALNYVLSGNFHHCVPQGRVVAFAGPSGSGKSFVQCNVSREAQKQNAFVLMIDSENALDDDFTSKIGIDVKLDYNYKSVVTIDSVIALTSAFLNGYEKAYGSDPQAPKVLIVIDSLDMLITKTEAEHFDKGDNAGDQGQRIRQLKAFLRQLVQRIKHMNVSIVVTHQVYAARQEQILKGEGVWVINDAVRYSLSMIALLTKLKLKDGTDITGIRLKAEGFKTRFTLPFQNVVIEVPYETGMDPCSGLVEMMEVVGVLEARGAYKQIVGTDTKFYKRDVAEYLEQLFEKFDTLTNKSVKLLSEEDELALRDVSETELQHNKRRLDASRLQQAVEEIKTE